MGSVKRLSGEPEIEEWFEDNEDDFFDEFEDRPTAEQLYEQIAFRFESDNRSDLDSILRDQRQTFIDFLDRKIQDRFGSEDSFEGAQLTEPPDPILQGMAALFG